MVLYVIWHKKTYNQNVTDCLLQFTIFDVSLCSQKIKGKDMTGIRNVGSPEENVDRSMRYLTHFIHIWLNQIWEQTV